MMEAIIITVVAEAIIGTIALIATIPSLKAELKRLNRNFEKANETQYELLIEVVRIKERVDNHINDTHAHNIQ